MFVVQYTQGKAFECWEKWFVGIVVVVVVVVVSGGGGGGGVRVSVDVGVGGDDSSIIA